jgi:glucosyl-3-phosphoglycerate synthase
VPGKGEALWKSLHATTGDIVCWLDADIENPSASFVSGLVGPLLADPSIHYVKGFYERPGGLGRVTELVARPLLSLHWPALAGLVQPLSGEYAGRRAVLEAVPFVSGYGVELGLLVDLLDLVGLDGLAQVDLDRRVHRSQDAQALGRMSFAVMQTALSRLEREGRITLADPPGATLVQFRHRRMMESTVPVAERPPMRDVRITEGD